MKFEHILNMEYSLRDALFLFWLIKEKSMPLSFVLYHSDYEFFDTENYILAINDPTMLSQQKKRLQKHLNKAKWICEMANNSYMGIGKTALYGSFSKSSEPNSFVHLEIVNFGVKGKPAIFHCLTYLLEFNLETSKPQWIVAEETKEVQNQWVKLLNKSGFEYEDKNVKEPPFHQIATFDLFGKILNVINELELVLDIKEEHPHKAIIDSLIPKYINEAYREELEYIFSYGKFNKEKVKWISGYKGLQEILRPYYDNETIPQHYQNWCDFAMNNFTKKDGRPLNKKSLQNAPTRQNRIGNSSQTAQDNFPKHSQTVPKSLPTVSIKAGGDVTFNLEQNTYNF